MLARGLEQTRGEIGDAVRRAGRGGELPGRELLLALAYKVLGRAMALTPVVTGTLRRSLRVWERGR
jgi:hypothetical protein